MGGTVLKKTPQLGRFHLDRAIKARSRTYSATIILLRTAVTPSVSLATMAARSLASLVGALPLKYTTPALSVSTLTSVNVAMCFAASLVFTLVVIN
jgi:hypothetical protein